MWLGPEVMLWAEVGSQGGWHRCGIYWVCKMSENYTDLGAILPAVSAGSGMNSAVKKKRTLSHQGWTRLAMRLTMLQPVPKPVHI